MFDERVFVFCTLKIGISYKVKQKKSAGDHSFMVSGGLFSCFKNS